MRYGFINNFSQILASDLAIGATSMTLDGGGALLSAATVDLVYTLTLDDGNGTTEIVHVTGQTTNDLTIERGKEGTTAQAWPTGTTVEMRLTAGVMDSATQLVAGSNLIILIGASSDAESTVIAIGDSSTVTETVSSGAFENVLVGHYSSVTDSAGSAGYGSKCHITNAPYSVSLGSYTATSHGGNSGNVVVGSVGEVSVTGFNPGTGVGYRVLVDKQGGVAMGPYSKAQAEYAIVMGYAATAELGSTYTIGVGSDLYTGTSNIESVLLGAFSQGANGESRAVAVGSRTFPSKAESVVIGSYAESNILGGMRIHGLPYLPDSAVDNASLTAANSVRRNAGQVAIGTDPLDLTDGAAAVTLDLPTGTRLFMDSIDVIINGSNAPGGTPQITVGPDDVTPAAYLAATTVSKTTVGERQTHTPLVRDGVTSLRVAVSTAGTGTTYTAKIVFRGYVMEL